ncbi:MAG: acyloxyacyl hydrolase [Longimicrobiales bacterium]
MRTRTAGVLCILLLTPSGIAAGQAASSQGDIPRSSVSVFVDHSIETGWPLSTIQTLSMERAGVELSRHLAGGGVWNLEYSIFVSPLTFIRNNPLTPSIPRGDHWVVVSGSPRATTFGAGLHPIGVRGALGSDRVAVSLGASLGLMIFERSIPGSNTARANFSGDLGIGIRARITERYDLMGGYQFNHLSNGGSGEENPGLDSHLLRVGLRRR